MKCVATATDTPGDDPRFGPWGKQRCEDTGPLTKKRMETIDEEFLKASLDFIDRANRDKKPFFVWLNPSRMHIWTRLKPNSYRVRPASVSIPTAWWSMMAKSGRILKKLDDLGIANNTIVIYTTDNGAETFSWPDGGLTPFRARRTPIGKAGTRPRRWCAGRASCRRARRSMTFSRRKIGMTTVVAAAGEPYIKNNSCRDTVLRQTFTVHLDGYYQRPFLARTGPDLRRESSTGPTMATSRVFVTNSGRRYSWSKRHMASPSGLSQCATASAHAVQPTPGPLRSSPVRGGRPCAMVRRSSFRRPRTDDRPGAPGELQQFPPRQKPGTLSFPASDGQAEEPHVGQLAIEFITFDRTLLCQRNSPEAAMHGSRFDYDVIAIGSGFGGSLTPRRATENGYGVGVMELGRRWPDSAIPKSNWDITKYLWQPIEMYGLQRLTYLDDVLVLHGAGVGAAAPW